MLLNVDILKKNVALWQVKYKMLFHPLMVSNFALVTASTSSYHHTHISKHQLILRQTVQKETGVLGSPIQTNAKLRYPRGEGV